MLIFKKIYIYNGTFRNYLKSKFVPNIHQNASNCTILKKFSRGDMPSNPPS